MTVGTVVSIGEALVDMIELGDNDQPTYLAAWGGSPFNVAVGASRLGSRVEFAGSFADDALGHRMREFLEAEKISLDLSVVVQAQTTIAMTSFVNFEPQYSFYASPASYGFLPPAVSQRQQIASAEVVHAGSLAVLEDLTYETIHESFRQARGIVTFDPNVRPRMVADWDQYRQRLGSLMSVSDFVKISLEDLEAAYPGQGEESVAMAILDQRAQAVVLTRGAEPVTLFTRNDRTDLALRLPYPVQDTTGGGDALMAGMTHLFASHGLPESHENWVTYVHNALLVSGVACSRRGGAIAMPRRDELTPHGFSL